jgi:cytochrome c-type biogenesis protein CcmH
VRRAAPLLVCAALLAVAPARSTASLTSQRPADTPRVQTTNDSVLEARTSAVAAQLRCPVCQGLSLQDSPSELAQSMRAVVRDQLAHGQTPDEVKAYFVSKYGEWILLAPEPSGFNLVAYAVPFFVVLGGGAVIFLAVRRWTSREEAAPSD